MSDHFPIAAFINCADQNPSQSHFSFPEFDKFAFNFDRSVEFKDSMRWRNEISRMIGDVKEMNDNLVGAIRHIIAVLGMRKDPAGRASIVSSTKLWYDTLCREARKSLTNNKIFHDGRGVHFTGGSFEAYRTVERNYEKLLSAKKSTYEKRIP